MRIFTSLLLGILTDLSHTASKDPDVPAVNAVELHTGHGSVGSEPGQTDLLCGSSTNLLAAGHAYAGCDGQLAAGAPILLPVVDAKAIIDVFKAAARNPLHAVDLRHDGERTLHVSEDPNLVDNGLSLRLSLADIDDYPLGVYRTLARELRTVVHHRDRGAEHATPRSKITAAGLEPFVKIAKRRKTTLNVYRTHQAEPWLVQIGDCYRGVVMPERRTDDDEQADQYRPDVDVHAPEMELPDDEVPAADDAGDTEDAAQPIQIHMPVSDGADDTDADDADADDESELAEPTPITGR